MPVKKILHRLKRLRRRHSIDNAEGFINNDNMPSNFKLPLLVFATFIIGLIIGFLISQSGTLNKIFPKQFNNANIVKADKIFSSQNGIINGVVTKVEGQNITIKSTSNVVGTFPLAPRFVVNKRVVGEIAPLISSEVKDIEVEKTVLIVVDAIDGQYKISSIDYKDPIKATSKVTVPPARLQGGSPSASPARR